MIAPPSPPQACHNCRRARLKCDRSTPQCLKCIKRNQECQGYQRLFRWEKGIASRGKLAGRTFDGMTMTTTKHRTIPSPNQVTNTNPHYYHRSHSMKTAPLVFLVDPLVQNLSSVSRRYLHYFASHVCRDLVLYDGLQQNPFRELIPLAHQNPILFHIIIANAALHMSNANQKSSVVGSMMPPSNVSTIERPDSYRHALAAKQQALYLLDSVITDISSADIDVILAVVLLFIEFELLHSGKDDWRSHTSGAKAIIESLCGTEISTVSAMSPLRRCLISNCLVFDILGTTLTRPNDPISINSFLTDAHSLLQDAEGNHCSSFPADLLQLIKTGARLSQEVHQHACASQSQNQASLILSNALSFNPVAWAIALQSQSRTADLPQRTHIAFAHRAAVCIYLSRVLLSLSPTTTLPQALDSLVAEVVSHLSYIQPDHALFTASTWPAFIAGAEATDAHTQQWVAKRFQAIWEIEPWGSTKGALGLLEDIWKTRTGNEEGDDLKSKAGTRNWIADLRGRGVDWLVA